jgi:hypothetical protein
VPGKQLSAIASTVSLEPNNVYSAPFVLPSLNLELDNELFVARSTAVGGDMEVGLMEKEEEEREKDRDRESAEGEKTRGKAVGVTAVGGGCRRKREKEKRDKKK